MSRSPAPITKNWPKRNVEDSKTIRARLQAARERQLERFKGTKLTCNAEIGPRVREFCQTDASGEKLLKAAVQQLHLSARASHRVLKLARTIEDLARSEMIAANHVAEAVQYRPTRPGCYTATSSLISSNSGRDAGTSAEAVIISICCCSIASRLSSEMPLSVIKTSIMLRGAKRAR